MDDVRATADFYDAAADTYDSQVDASPDHVATREAFRARVLSLTKPGGLLLDFGCGTGLDAAWYVKHDRRVLAYDLSPRMVDVLRARCNDEIARGLIVAFSGSMRVLEEALERHGPVDAVAANFAVFNHVRHLRSVFHTLARGLAPGNAMVASVLNPFYVPDMKRAWWWRAFVRSVWSGAITYHGAVTTHRHLAGSIRKAAAPDFVVSSVESVHGVSWSHRLMANFLFFVFEKEP